MLEDTSGNQENAGQERQLSYIAGVVAGREEVCELYISNCQQNQKSSADAQIKKQAFRSRYYEYGGGAEMIDVH